MAVLRTEPLGIRTRDLSPPERETTVDQQSPRGKVTRKPSEPRQVVKQASLLELGVPGDSTTSGIYPAINRLCSPMASDASRIVYFELQNALHADRTRVGCADRRAN